MAISLARAHTAGKKLDIARKQAAEYEAQAKKAKNRGFFSGILGKGLGSVIGAGAVGALGLTGFGVPLAMALGSMAGKKGAHELTRGMGADASAISESDMYGFGKESGSSLRKDLESQMVVDPFKEKGGFGKELLSSTLSAGLAGDLGGATKSLMKGDVGKAFVDPEAIGGLDKGGAAMWAGAKESIAGLIPGYSDITKGTDTTMDYESLKGSGMTGPEYDALVTSRQTNYIDDADDWFGDNEIINPELDELGYSIAGDWAQGGQVPQQQQLLQLLALASTQQQQNAYSDTPLEEVKQLSIADKFAAQGKTLGGNDIQSLSQKLGR
tara:strand:+ start:1179 stop:2156 length:978 start_codon:yes stop_codon:yes gene_type:complete